MSPLHSIGDFVRELLLQVPLWAARGLFLALIAALLIWVLLLPRKAVLEHPEKPARLTENLKLWAAIALGIQLVVYALF